MIDLGNRKIFLDGTVICRESAVIDLLFQDKSLETVLVEPCDDVALHNRTDRYLDTNYGELKTTESPVFENVNWFQHWVTPEEYINLDIEMYVLSKCTSEQEFFRAKHELELFNARNMYPVLRHLVYLVDHWREQKILWGVGRGSSVSSLVLYLIGINRINPLDYDLNIDEFLK